MNGALMILFPAALLVAGCAGAQISPAASPKVLEVKYEMDSSKGCVESIGDYKKLEKANSDTLRLRFDNQCSATMDVAIRAGEGPTASCGQPAVAGPWKVSIAPGKEERLDCSIVYEKDEHKMRLRKPDPERASELVLDEVP